MKLNRNKFWGIGSGVLEPIWFNMWMDLIENSLKKKIKHEVISYKEVSIKSKFDDFGMMVRDHNRSFKISFSDLKLSVSISRVERDSKGFKIFSVSTKLYNKSGNETKHYLIFSGRTPKFRHLASSIAKKFAQRLTLEIASDMERDMNGELVP